MKRASVSAWLRLGAALFGASAMYSASMAAIAQASASTMPSDAKELMLLAAKTNRLRSPDLKPWHLVATYQIFNDDGSIKSEGTMEEFWVSPTKNKLIYTSGAQSQTIYDTGQGEYTVGGAGMDLLPAYRSHREMTEPLPAIITDNDYAIGELDTGGVAAVCLHRQDVDGRTYDPTWCFEPGSPTLRITVNANSEDVLHSNPVSFQGRTIPADVKFSGGELKSIETDRPAFS